MPSRNIYLTYIVATVLVVGAGATFALRPTPTLLSTTSHSTSTAPTTETASRATQKAPKKISVSFALEGVRHVASIPKNANVLDLMNMLRAEKTIGFSGKEYSSLGFFVEEISGKKNANGYYWILYMNGKPSNTGVSQTALKANDSVEWRYEKGY